MVVECKKYTYNTQIKINAKEIATKVKNSDFQSFATQTASLLSTKVSTTDFNSEVTQTADALRSIVSKSSISGAEEVDSPYEFSDQTKIYVIRTRTESGYLIKEEYYRYNSNSGYWEQISGDSIYTCFEQTSSGFKLKGTVSVDGDVVANSLQGETITGTTISGSTINGSTITGGNIYTGLFSYADDATRTSAKNKIRINGYSVDYLRNDDDNSLLPYFKVSYGDRPNYTSDVVEFSATTKGKHFLRVEPTAPQTVTSYTGNNVGYVIPYGTWNFSECIIDWGNNAPSSVAVFG